MSGKKDMYRNIVLISQVSINVMVPTFVCLALGLWIDGKFGTWSSIPLLIIGMLAGARNAYIFVMNVIRQDERKRKKQLEREIQEKIKKAENKKIDDMLRR